MVMSSHGDLNAIASAPARARSTKPPAMANVEDNNALERDGRASAAKVTGEGRTQAEVHYE